MEILSDATFKGSVTLSNSSVAGQGLKFVSSNGTILQLSTVDTGSLNNGASRNGCVLQLGFEDGGWSGRGIGFATDQIYADQLYVGSHVSLNLCTITVNGSKLITFPSSSGILALTSQIPSLSGYLTKNLADSIYTKVKNIPINFDVAASCTKFTVSTDLSGVDLQSMAMFRCVDTSDLGYTSSTPNEHLYKQVAVDLYQIGCSHTVLVEKSSSFAIGASDGYELKLIYLGW